MMKKYAQKPVSWILTVLIVILLFNGICLPQASAASTWDGTVDTDFAGSGTSSEPYLITSAAELAGVSSLGHDNNFYGKYFSLTVDIDLAGRAWTPIGYNYGFRASFDGQYHVISNLAIGTSGEPCTFSNVGLFTSLSSGGALKNLGLENVSIYASSTNVGGFAGSIVSGMIQNCYITGSIINSYQTNSAVCNTGSIAGISMYTSSPIMNCCSTASVTSQNTVSGTYNSHTGGLFGTASSVTIQNCFAAGTVTSATANYFGNVFGKASGDNLTDVYVNSSLLGNAIGFDEIICGG